MKNGGAVVAIVVLVVVILLLLGGVQMTMFGWGMPHMAGGFGFFPLGGLMMLAFWLFIIGGAVLLIWWFTKNPGAARVATNEPALDILKVRYAKGEITKEQFEEMKHNLSA